MKEVWPVLQRELEARVATGERKYGRRLTTANGRDALRDAWEEAADLLMYLTQCLMERPGPVPTPPEIVPEGISIVPREPSSMRFSDDPPVVRHPVWCPCGEFAGNFSVTPDPPPLCPACAREERLLMAVATAAAALEQGLTGIRARLDRIEDRLQGRGE